MKKHDREALASIIDLIADQAEDMFKDAKLAKADPGEETPGEDKPEGSSVEGTKTAPPPSAPSDDASATPPPPPPPADASAPPSDAPPSDGPPMDPSAGGDAPPIGDPAAAGGGEMNPEAIKQQIMHLPLEVVQMYYLAFATRLQELAPGADAGAAGGAPPPPAPEATPPAPAAGGDLPMGKGEFDDQSGEIMKSINGLVTELRTEIAGYKGTVESLQNIVATQTATLMKSMARPVRKSILATDLGVPEAKPLAKKDVSGITRGEIVKRLSKVTAKPDLSKSDRDLVKQYMRGDVTSEKIAHLVIE